MCFSLTVFEYFLYQNIFRITHTHTQNARVVLKVQYLISFLSLLKLVSLFSYLLLFHYVSKPPISLKEGTQACKHRGSKTSQFFKKSYYPPEEKKKWVWIHPLASTYPSLFYKGQTLSPMVWTALWAISSQECWCLKSAGCSYHTTSHHCPLLSFEGINTCWNQLKHRKSRSPIFAPVGGKNVIEKKKAVCQGQASLSHPPLFKRMNAYPTGRVASSSFKSRAAQRSLKVLNPRINLYKTNSSTLIVIKKVDPIYVPFSRGLI